jgi:thiol-disulfide isomerase/thioredoxin
LNTKILAVVVAIISLALGGYFGAKQFRVTDTPPDLSELAGLELPDVEKNVRNGSEWLGKVVIVNHWATWCGPCREEIPMLIDYQEQMADQGIQVVGVAHDLLDQVRVFGDEIGISYPSLVAIVGGSQLLAAHGNNKSGALPFTAIFDRDGKIARTKLGLLSLPELQSMVQPLL